MNNIDNIEDMKFPILKLMMIFFCVLKIKFKN